MRFGRILKRWHFKRVVSALDPDTDYEQIVREIVWQYPVDLNLSHWFGFFRTYGAPSISTLLFQTNESVRNPRKRTEDTAYIISYLLMNGLNEPTSGYPLGLINMSHSRFKIPNEDYLYVLSIFILEPMRMNKLYSWKIWSEREKRAYCNFFVELGKKMGIENIPSRWEQFVELQDDYERRNFVFQPHQTVLAKKLKGAAGEESFFFVGWMLKLGLPVVLGNRLSVALGLPIPSAFRKGLTWVVFKLGYLLIDAFGKAPGINEKKPLFSKTYPDGAGIYDVGTAWVRRALDPKRKLAEKTHSS